MTTQEKINLLNALVNITNSKAITVDIELLKFMSEVTLSLKNEFYSSELNTRESYDILCIIKASGGNEYAKALKECDLFMAPKMTKYYVHVVTTYEGILITLNPTICSASELGILQSDIIKTFEFEIEE